MLVQKALQFGEQKHSGQTRKNGMPYFTHCEGVYQKVKALKLDKKYEIASILHDVIEAGTSNQKELALLFTPEVAELVQSLSKKEKSHFSSGKIGQHQRIEAYVKGLEKAVKKHPGILHIKICDQLDNLEDVAVFSEQKYYRIIWTINVYFLPLYEKHLKKLPKKYTKTFDLLYLQLSEKIDLLMESTHKKNQNLLIPSETKTPAKMLEVCYS